jgi:hypothetical protein
VTALIGTRLYPVVLPQAPTFPAVSYQWISGVGFPNMENTGSLRMQRVQFTAWAPTYTAAVQVFEAVRARLNGFKGVNGGTQFEGAFFVNEVDLYEPEPQLYGRAGDFFVWTAQ